jgi:hypothetical protein
MTALEMVAKLRIAMGDEVEPYVVSTQTIFEWLSDAYLRIQIEYEQWKFFHSRGLILTTVAGQAEYEIYNVKEISKDSVYCNKVGESARFPMYFCEYDIWVAEEQVNLQMQGTPRYFISLPNGNYRIEPDPTEAWQIWGDVWYKPAGFDSLGDEPIWDEKFHSLVVWEALKVASLEWPDSKKAQRMQANVAVNLLPMRRAFNYEYLDPKGSARAML